MFLPGELLPAVVERLADICFESMYRGAPWRSGRLAMSIVKQVDGLSARVGPTVSYAKFVSEGTVPHQILPRTARALAFPGGDLGGVVFAKRVMHPGTRANPYVENAVAETRGQVFSVFQDVWAEL
jgi:hypothetical protein